MLLFFKYALLAIVGGASAVLPVSATFIIFALNSIFAGNVGESHYVLGFTMLGSAAAIMFLHYKSFFAVIASELKKRGKSVPYFDVNSAEFSCKDLLIGCTPLLLLFFPIGKGLFLFNISDFILNNNLFVVEAVVLIFSGLLYFLAITKSIKPKKCLKFNRFAMVSIGTAQMLSALLPGSSHMALSFSTAALLRRGRNKSVIYSYLISFPALICGGFLHIILGSVTEVSFHIFVPVLMFLLSFFSSVFGILVFSALAGRKKSRFISYANVALGIFVLIINLIRLFIN